MPITCLFTLLFAICLQGCTHHQARYILYVTPDGKSADCGEITDLAEDKNAEVFPSLAAARDHIRMWRRTHPPCPVEIRISAGVYTLSEPFTLNTEDSGTTDNPVVYRAYGSGRPRIIGGTLITRDSIRQEHDDLISFAISKEETKVIRAPDSRLGRYEPGFEVFWNRQRLTLARWPATTPDAAPGDDWLYVDSVPVMGSKTGLRCHKLPSWLVEEQSHAEIYVFPGVDWYDHVCELANYDNDSRLLTLSHPTAYAITPGDRFYLRNVRHGLSAPGTWWFDAADLRVYVHPPAGEHSGELLISRLPSILQLRNVNNITFSGLTFECCSQDAIVIDKAKSLTFAGNIVGLTGGWGVVATTDGPLELTGNIIHSTGLGGMKLTGGNRHDLTAAHINASDNELTRMGQNTKCYQPAFYLDGVGLVVAHNHIHGLPHNAILFGGNDQQIRNNLIEDVCRDTNDAGAIYTGRDWSCRGTRIEGNVIRHVSGWGIANRNDLANGKATFVRYETGGAAQGVYFDDMVENAIVQGNVFADIDAAAIQIGGGSYHTITQNYFLRCRTGLFVYSLTSFASAQAKLKPFDYEGSPYRKAYPEIVDRALHDPLVPSHLSVEGNHFIGVSQSYRITLMSSTNRFHENRFDGTTPNVLAMLTGGTDRTLVNDWHAWQNKGLDSDSVLESSASQWELAAIKRIVDNAGPRDRGAILALHKFLPSFSHQKDAAPVSIPLR